MDENDLAALDKFVEAIKAACAGGRAVSEINLTWGDASDNMDEVQVRPFLTVKFSDVPVGEAVGCGDRT